MNADKIFELLKTAVNIFYMRDKQLVEKCCLERTCVSRIADYLQQILDVYGQAHDLSVDCEYGSAVNDDGEILKKYLDSYGVYADQNGNKDRIFPDLIVHKRGTHEQNILVVEFKGFWNDDELDWDTDRLKLEKFTNTDSPKEIKNYFNYKLGVFVALEKNKGYFVRFKDGRQVSKGDSVNDLFKNRRKL